MLTPRFFVGWIATFWQAKINLKGFYVEVVIGNIFMDF